MKPSIGVAIVGGSGYGAGELLRYLTAHAEAQVASIVSSSQAGESVTKAHPHLAGFYSELKFDSTINWENLKKFERQIIFLALPHGHSAKALQQIQSAKIPGVRVIDLAADFRLTDEELHSKTYPDVPYENSLRSKFVYGLPEINREQISKAQWITNPGCLATACILAAAPLLEKSAGAIVGSLCFDAKTGTSGAGRSPQESMHHPNRHGNFEAYKVLAHRHEPEIRQALTHNSRGIPACMFVPHLLPTVRGIFVTLYAQLNKPLAQKDLESTYQKAFAQSPCIRFRDGSPTLHDVVGTNFCDIAITVRDTQVVVMAALDNLGKGMAGQAIQNMNLMFGLSENLGIMQPSLGIA